MKKIVDKDKLQQISAFFIKGIFDIDLVTIWEGNFM